MENEGIVSRVEANCMKGSEICIVWVDSAQSITAGATRYGLQKSEVDSHNK